LSVLVASERISLIVSALLLSIGIGVGGFFIGDGIANRNAGRRIISVKGLSEREVAASVATWTIGYNATGNDVGEINKKLADSTKAVVAFLRERGFDEKELAVQPPSIRDTSMEARQKDVPPPPERYSANQAVLLRTSKVDAIKPALASASNLMISGVLLAGGSQPNYIFNQVNEIKPGMIQEATKNARIAADQFARDSQITLGKLRNASQGWFQIEDRDAATPERKTVRVVVDVEYEVK
jgi:hypothetical protein